MRKSVIIVNRGGAYTNRGKAQRYIDRGFASAVSTDADGNLLEIQMLPAAQAAKMYSGLSARKEPKHDLRSSQFMTKGRQVGNNAIGTTAALKLRTGPTAEELHWRESVLLRDDYKCVFCGSSQQLEADHVKPKAVYPDLKYDVSNGRTLCGPCHRKTDTYGRKTDGITKVECIA